MRIGLDARWIFRELSGIGANTRELIRALAQADRANEYVLFFNDLAVLEETAEFAGLEQAPNCTTHFVPFGPFSLRGQLLLPHEFRRHRLDVFHSTNYMIPLCAFPRRRKGRTACVVTIHDVIPLLFPDHAPKALKTRLFPLFRWLMREVGRRADAIIAVSRSTRADVLRELRLPAEREPQVVVVPNGVAPEFKPAPRAPHGPKTILYVGRLDPYKNVVRLIEAFGRLAAEHVADVRLRIVGADDPRYPEARQRAAALGLGHRLDWTGHVSGGELVQAYQQADVFALPSRYEGFGLTVLEAMACGTPVVCSNTSSLPEVAGDAALFVPPGDVPALAHALRRVLTEPPLWAELSAKGLRQAAPFTWTRTAEQTIKVYEQVAATAGG